MDKVDDGGYAESEKGELLFHTPVSHSLPRALQRPPALELSHTLKRIWRPVPNQAPSVLSWPLLIPAIAWTPTTRYLTCFFLEIASTRNLMNLFTPQDLEEGGTEKLGSVPAVTQASGFKFRQCDSEVHTLNLCAQGLSEFSISQLLISFFFL